MEKAEIRTKPSLSSYYLKLKSNTQHYFVFKFVLKVVTLYVLASFLVDAYIAVVDPLGRFDFSQTLGRVNLVDLLRDSILCPSKWLLILLGYETFTSLYRVGITGSGGVQIVYSCIGIKALLAFVILIVCYPSPSRKRWLFLLIALPIMHLLNIIRITVLAIINKTSYTLTLEHHDLYNYIIYGYIALAFYLFATYFSDYKKIHLL